MRTSVEARPALRTERLADAVMKLSGACCATRNIIRAAFRPDAISIT